MRLKLKRWSGVFLFFLLFSCSKEAPISIDDPTLEETGVQINAATLRFPKKEMRAVWLATVWGLDWPQSDYSSESQKNKYVTLLDKCQELNINTVFVQVKGMGDAFYDSPYENWSAAITGVRGKKPDYDVLRFMIDEAHARGIQFHAWMNPYRISTRANSSVTYPVLHHSIDPAWVVSHEKIQIYNPAIPAVRMRLADIVKDLIVTYNVDGIHFDDYFYPAASAAEEIVSDAGDFATYGAGYDNIENFRRDNVNKTIKAVYDIISIAKPSVVFSVSPGPNRDYNYNSLYADVVKWCEEGWIDIVIPQLYQEIGNPYNDFDRNLKFWSDNNYKATLLIGHGLYKFGDPTEPVAFQNALELEKQFDLTRANAKVMGNVMYSAKYLHSNHVGVVDKLKAIYKSKVLVPFVGNSSLPKPAAPSQIHIINGKLKWDNPANERSVVYYFESKEHEGQILTITADKSFEVSLPGYYCVASLGVDGQETRGAVAVQKK